MATAEKTPEEQLKVFISTKASKCDECGEDLGHKTFIFLEEGKGALCMECAGMNHLVFLPSGDAAMTRRSKKYSRLSAVVLKWSRARRRYERKGLLVEEKAVEKAKNECAADADKRKARQAKAALKSAELDKKYIAEFSLRIRELFPGMPKGMESGIAKHACRKYSGRVGRCASAKQLDKDAITLAVIAHIRHVETDYDELLLKGNSKLDARKSVKKRVGKILRTWQD